MSLFVLTDGFDEFVGNEVNVVLMLTHAARQVGNKDDAYDVVQNARIKLYQHWSTIRTHPNPSAYIYAVLQSAADDFRESTRYTRSRPGDEEILQAIHSEFNVESFVLLRESIRELLRRARNPYERQLLRYLYMGYKAREIAVELKRSLPTVESHIQRLRERLRNDRL